MDARSLHDRGAAGPEWIARQVAHADRRPADALGHYAKLREYGLMPPPPWPVRVLAVVDAACRLTVVTLALLGSGAGLATWLAT